MFRPPENKWGRAGIAHSIDDSGGWYSPTRDIALQLSSGRTEGAT